MSNGDSTGEQYSSDIDRSAVFNAEIDIAGLASELGYKVGEYEVEELEYEGDGQIRVNFRTLNSENDHE